MNKRYLHHLWTRLRPVKTWYFLAACLVCTAVCVMALRNNYTTMTRLRAAVYTADEQNADVVGALTTLRSYVNAHMNTDLATGSVYPPIQLTHTYERLQQAERQRVDAANSQIYTDAQHHCEALYPASISGGPRVPCIEQYVKDHGTSVQAIPDALYKFNFVSPQWSPDLAGWALAASILLFALAILRFLLGRLLEALTK